MTSPFATLDLDKLSLKSGSSGRRASKTNTPSSKYQERRRTEALERQQHAKEQRAALARSLALQTRSHNQKDNESEQADDSDVGQDHLQHSYQDYAKQLLQPEWFIDVPMDFFQDWYVMPRPEGQRCLVIASQGQTVSRLRNGMKLHQFPSLLPSGSRRTLSGPEDFCILDCIFCQQQGVYYIMDLMCWKGYSLYDCSTEFRLFWRESKLREDLDNVDGGWGSCRYSFVPVPVHNCSPEGLREAHSGAVPFQRDGCYFIHKECRYDPDSPTPLALLWKDPACSQYFIDTDMKGDISSYQHVVLQVTESGAVSTGDDPPIALGTAPTQGGQQLHRPGKLLRFTIREGGIQLKDGEPHQVDLFFEGTANPRRGRVDLWTKILFQHMARCRPLLLQDILPNDEPGVRMEV